MRLSALGEKGLIRRISRLIKNDPTVLRGIGDDCAVLAGPPGKYLLFASDMLVEGVHFKRSASATAVGWKALAVNVSDVAAMGGIPRYAVVSLGLPRETPVRCVDGLYRGLSLCAKKYGVNLVGGDTNRAERLVIAVAILGEVEKGRVVYRSGARVGDQLLVTGRLGGSVRGGRHLTFLPRVKEARALGAEVRLHAMIDLSDGLMPDLTRLCEASRVSAEIDASLIPRRKGASLKAALTEGEDFELLISVGKADADGLLKWSRKNLSCGLTRIGEVIPRRPNRLVGFSASAGVRIPKVLDGFQHF